MNNTLIIDNGVAVTQECLNLALDKVKAFYLNEMKVYLIVNLFLIIIIILLFYRIHLLQKEK